MYAAQFVVFLKALLLFEGIIIMRAKESYLMYLAIGSSPHHFNQLEYSSRVLGRVVSNQNGTKCALYHQL